MSVDVIIYSTERVDWLRFKRYHVQDPEYTGYAVTACVDGAQLVNNDVDFGGVDQFLSELSVFEAHRSGKANLFPSNEFSLSVEADGTGGHAWVTFFLSRRLRAHSHESGLVRDGLASIQGSFPVPGESIGQMLRDFRALFHSNL